MLCLWCRAPFAYWLRSKLFAFGRGIFWEYYKEFFFLKKNFFQVDVIPLFFLKCKQLHLE